LADGGSIPPSSTLGEMSDRGHDDELWETDDRLQRDYPDCQAAQVGLVNTPYRRRYQQLGGVGTVAMLEAEGFEPVRTYDDRRLVMQLKL
jgi:hypothetical protein